MDNLGGNIFFYYRALKHKKNSNVGELRAVLGLLSYYQQYVKDPSRIASPLYELLKTPREKQVKNK